MVRVCLLTPALDAFKGGNHLPLLAALPEVEFTILTSRMKPADAAVPPNIHVECISARLGPYYYGFSDWRFARAVLRRHPADDPFWNAFDVLHLNQTMGPALLELRKTNTPILFFIHHPVSADLAIAVQESSMTEGWKWRLKYALLRHWQRRFVREIRHVATVSHTAAERIATDYRCDITKIHIVPNGVDPELFIPGDCGTSDFDVIAVGSFVHPRKGFRYLAEAYRLLSGRGCRMADVGRRSPDQRQELSSIPGVRVFGTVPEEQLLSLLRRSAIPVSTSLYEGFGLSLIEALSCGRPAFAFEGGAVREVLDTIDPALVVPARDTAALVQRVTDFLALPLRERAERGEMYRDRVLHLYSLERSARILGELYDRLRKEMD